LDWDVVRVWEHEVREGADAVVRRVVQLIVSKRRHRNAPVSEPGI
jgi:very-short-patch-repair endonuclease